MPFPWQSQQALWHAAADRQQMAPLPAGTTGSAEAGTGTDGNGNTVIVAMGSGFSTLDPGHVYEKYPQLIANACYENLFKFYENNGTPATMSG